jgi:hypothetical protein
MTNLGIGIKEHTEREAKAQANEKSILYSGDVYDPEVDFATWMNLAYIGATTSLLFYHMSRVKSVELDARIAAGVSVAIMLISIFYMIVSIVPYTRRMQHVADACKAAEACTDANLRELRETVLGVQIVGIATTVIMLFICGLIVWNTWQSFR